MGERAVARRRRSAAHRLSGAGAVLYLVYPTALFGYSNWNYLLRKHKTSLVAPLTLLVPILGMLSSMLIFHEDLTARKLVAVVLVIVGLLSSRSERIVMLSGRCLCGSIRYRVTGAPLRVSYCHCEQCRRFTRAPVFAAAQVARAEFEIEGKTTQFRSSEHGVRHFCSTCGSSLFFELENRLNPERPVSDRNASTERCTV
jgi:hypothetical protein